MPDRSGLDGLGGDMGVSAQALVVRAFSWTDYKVTGIDAPAVRFRVERSQHAWIGGDADMSALNRCQRYPLRADQTRPRLPGCETQVHLGHIGACQLTRIREFEPDGWSLVASGLQVGHCERS
jgi:hypothetical protein